MNAARGTAIAATTPRAARSGGRRTDSADRAGRLGWQIILVFFGVFGSWALLAPLNGAVIAPAEIKISGNRKSIQHLEGGIVRDVAVKEGDTVGAGDPLVVLDDSQARTEYAVLDQLHIALRLTEARLQVEQSGGSALEIPAIFADRGRDSDVIEAWRGQMAQLEARRREIEGQTEITRQRIGQLEAQIGGAAAQLSALRRQQTSMSEELTSLTPLMKQGIVTRTRLLQLERSIAALEGQIGDANGGIARAEQAISEQRQLEVQGRNQRASAVAQELRDVQMRLAEVVAKIANARSVHGRTVVRAPYAGRVVGLNVFAVGAVIGRGEKLMDIVPDAAALIVEARIAVEDVAEIAEGAPGEVRLTGYKQQSTPTLHGRIVHVSADRLTDTRTGAPYYIANIRIDDSELAALPDIKLQPGMSATAMIPTISRTAFQYLVGPLLGSLGTAFRQR